MTLLGYIMLCTVLFIFIIGPGCMILYYCLRPVCEKIVWRWDRKKVEKLTSITTILPYNINELTISQFTKELNDKMAVHRCHIGNIRSITTSTESDKLQPGRLHYLTVWHKIKAYERKAPKAPKRNIVLRDIPKDSFMDAFKFNL